MNHATHNAIAEEILAKVAADAAYQNAMKNNDKKTARIEHDAALQQQAKQSETGASHGR